jgi:mannose/cellobiose epimerase-like protein (N-acyl-D-glucosamine 2-epimerase family)
MERTASFFRDQRWLSEHLRRLVGYPYPVCMDPVYGGYIAQLSDVDGHVYDGKTKHLVATCRYVYNFSVAETLDGPTWCKSAAEAGIAFLENHFRDPDRDGYYWLLSGTDVEDDAKLCYGHAFVLLAYATAANASIGGARERVPHVYDLVDEHYWEPEHDLCRIELDADWSPASEYRGQNSNMHLCEALVEAYRATDESRYLDRAFAIARALVRDLASDGDGLVWEHYTPDWSIDWEYNRGNQTDRFRISVDTRYQSIEDPVDGRWVGADPVGHYEWPAPDQTPMAELRAEWGL